MASKAMERTSQKEQISACVQRNMSEQMSRLGIAWWQMERQDQTYSSQASLRLWITILKTTSFYSFKQVVIVKVCMWLYTTAVERYFREALSIWEMKMLQPHSLCSDIIDICLASLKGDEWHCLILIPARGSKLVGSLLCAVFWGAVLQSLRSKHREKPLCSYSCQKSQSGCVFGDY